MSKPIRWEGKDLDNLLSMSDDELFSTYPDTKPASLKRLRAMKLREQSQSIHKDKKLAQLEHENRTIKNKYEAVLSDKSNKDVIQHIFEQVVSEHTPVPLPESYPRSGGITEEHAVLCIGDLHFGEVVDKEQTGGIATYNLDVGKRRLDETVDTAIDIIKNHLKGYHVPKIHIFLLGDLVSGEIHEELRNSNEKPIIGQTLFVLSALEENIKKLCGAFEQVEITSIAGNHGRKKEAYYFKDKATENFDYLISKLLERIFINQKNLKWNIPQSYWALQQVQNIKYMIMHGDGIRSWMGLPFYGLKREFLSWKVLAQDYGIAFDDLIVGHFHNPNIFQIQRNSVIINGGLMGGDDYSLGALSVANDPVQLLWGVHPEHGRTWTYQINTGYIT
jgi:predicted phosphodiesterase